MDLDNIDEIDLKEVDRALRPKTWDGFCGQEELKEKLKIAIEAAQQRDEPVAHTLLVSSPGLGKSSIAQIISNEYGSKLKTIMGPSIRTVSDVLKVLCKIERNSFLFIDEIHAIKPKTQETLYSAMENFEITNQIDSKNILHIKINPFTLIAATTDIGQISEPMRDRFGIIHTLSLYSDDELLEIIKHNIDKIDLVCDNDELLLNIAKRSRGVPRLANRLLHRIRDYVQINNGNEIDQKSIDYVMDLENIDENGLTKFDSEYLSSLFIKFDCVPTGIISLSSSLGHSKEFLENYIEPFLLNKNLIAKSKQGRFLTTQGLEYINENIL